MDNNDLKNAIILLWGKYKTMSQQTRIDEFYKSIGKQKSTVINVKKCARSKSIPYSKRVSWRLYSF